LYKTTHGTNQDWVIKIVTDSIHKQHKSMLSDEYEGQVLFQELAAHHVEVWYYNRLNRRAVAESYRNPGSEVQAPS